MPGSAQECNGNIQFLQPDRADVFTPGSNPYVKVGAEEPDDIQEISLYSDGVLVRSEMRHPYEWGGQKNPNDSVLGSPEPGKFAELKAVATYKCGGTNTVKIRLRISKGSGHGTSGNDCNGIVRFAEPDVGAILQQGSTIYVRVDPEKRRDIEHIDLYFDGSLVRRENRHPYEWGKNNSSSDAPLRGLQAGGHELSAEVVSKCGDKNFVSLKFQVN